MIFVDMLSLNRLSLLFTVHHIFKKKSPNVWNVYRTCVYLFCNQKQQAMKNLIEKYESLGFNLSVKEEPMFVGYCVRKVSKARFPKPLFNYRFRSAERMAEFCMEWIERVERNINAEKARKEMKKAAQQNMNHNFKVGQFIYNSWGYDQTNINFYQIVGVKEKSIVLQEVSKSIVAGSEGFMCANVQPVENAFVGEPILKKVIVQVGYNGNVSYYIKAEHGCFCEYAASQQGVYSSWYA